MHQTTTERAVSEMGAGTYNPSIPTGVTLLRRLVDSANFDAVRQGTADSIEARYGVDVEGWLGGAVDADQSGSRALREETLKSLGYRLGRTDGAQIASARLDAMMEPLRAAQTAAGIEDSVQKAVESMSADVPAAHTSELRFVYEGYLKGVRSAVALTTLTTTAPRMIHVARMTIEGMPTADLITAAATERSIERQIRTATTDADRMQAEALAAVAYDARRASEQAIFDMALEQAIATRPDASALAVIAEARSIIRLTAAELSGHDRTAYITAAWQPVDLNIVVERQARAQAERKGMMRQSSGRGGFAGSYR